MSSLISIFTGQFADMDLKDIVPVMAEMGYEGLEIATGNHIDPDRAEKDDVYCQSILDLMNKYNMKISAISCHCQGQLVCDLNNDERSDSFAPSGLAGNPEGKRAWAVDQVKKTAIVAKKLGVKTVTGFTGSSIWHLIYSFPPVSPKQIDEGFEYFANMFNPILDVYDECGVKFALEVHPTEIAFDTYTAKRALEAVGNREAFGINFDPSHLQWQGMDPAEFIYEFRDRIYNVHMKDCAVTLDGKSGILSSYINFGSYGRGWDFRSLGHGDVDFESIIRALRFIGYEGPLAVEWEDAMMDRMYGAKESCDFVKGLCFPKSDRVFDEAFSNNTK